MGVRPQFGANVPVPLVRVVNLPDIVYHSL